MSKKSTILPLINNATNLNLHNVLMQSPYCFAILKGRNSIIVLANDSIKEVWGKGKEVEGKSLFDVLPEIRNQGFPELIERVYTTGIPFIGEEIFVKLLRGGKLVDTYFNFTYEPYREMDGTISGITIIAYEVTFKAEINKKIKESETYFRLIAELMPEKVSNALPDGTVIYYNKSWQEYTGSTFDTLIEEGWEKWVHPDDVAEAKAKWLNAVATKGDFDMNLRMLNHKGAYRWHTCRARCVKSEDGGVKIWVGSNSDIHNQKTRTETLEKAVEERTKALQKANIALKQKNKDIEESKNKLLSDYSRSLIEASIDPLIVISVKGKMTDMNQAAINIMGETRKILRGRSFFEYFTDPQKAKEVYEEVFSKGFVTNYPLTIKDYKLTPVLFNGSLYKDEKGNVLGAVVVARDITEQNRVKDNLEESLKEVSDYKYALDASSIVDVVDYKGNMKYVNDNFCQISQYTAAELIGKHYTFLMSGYHSEAFMQNLIDTVSSGKIWRDELCKKAKDGSLYWVLTTIVPFLNEQGKPYQYVSIRTDITEQKRVASELFEAKVFAESAVKVAEDAQNKAEDAVKAKQQFLSNMSHEIRTPMNAIIGFTKVVLKTDLSARQKEYLTAIKMSGDSLIVLINDILDLAKVDSGKMTFEKAPFKLSASISTMLHLFETKIQEKNLKFVKVYDEAIPDVLIGDPMRLHQIIMNLLSNAVKFTNEGSITMSVKMKSEDAEKVTIEFAIKDTGIGIEAAKIDKIFDNFQQAADNTTHLFGGTGLGLSIVKQLIEPQGGTISVKSKITEGSTFSFTLSFLKTDATAEVQETLIALDPDIKNIKVLVVEDIALNQLLMKTILDDFGFERDIVGNGRIAVEKLTQKDAYGNTKAYDVILMDLQMPEMNGFEATKYIRNTLNLKIPIIALTADVTIVDLARCKAVGMNDYMAKPVDERVLYTKIVNLVKKTLPHMDNKDGNAEQITQLKRTNLSYLMKRTKSNTILMSEMIDAYLEQTPNLIHAMKKGLETRDWQLLHSAVHKMIPSFMIMGISNDFEMMAKKVMEYTKTQQEASNITDFVAQLEEVCVQACDELRETLNTIKNTNKNEEYSKNKTVPSR